MPSSVEFRGFAAAQRREADLCALELMRDRYLASAERWEALAAEIEVTERAARSDGASRRAQLFY
jgi:hypothetical protein